MTDRTPHIALRAAALALGMAATTSVLVMLAMGPAPAGSAIVLAAGGSVLAILGLLLRVRIRRFATTDRARTMYGAVAPMLAIVLGPALGGAAAIGGSLAADVAGRVRPVRMVPHLASRVPPVLVAAWTFTWAGGTWGAVTLPADYLPLAAAALAGALASELLVALDGLTRLDEARRRRVDLLDDGLRGAALAAMHALVGAGVVAAVLADPWLAPIVAPLAAEAWMLLVRDRRTQEVTERALETFASIVDERDRYTYLHSDRVCALAVRVGRRMELSERRLERLYWAARLHDLGKVAVDNAILNKPGQLDEAEFEVMKVHAVVSSRILASFGFNADACEAVLCHHERWDGRGYLHRPAEHVPLEAFIVAVVDAFDAMTSDRPYRDALPEESAFEEIARGLGAQFHPEVGRSFLVEMGWDVEEGLARIARDDARLVARGEFRRPVGLDAGDDIRPAA